MALLGTQVAVMSLGLVSGIVLARCLGAEGRGIIAAILIYPNLFLGFTELGVQRSSVYYLGRGAFSDQQVVSAVSTLILLTGALGIALATAALIATRNEAFTPLLIGLAVASIPLTLVKDYAAGILLGKRLVGQFAGIQRVAELQRLLLVVILVWWLSLDVLGALVATLLSGVLVAGFALRRVTRIAPLRPAWEWTVLRALLGKGMVYAAASFVLTLNYRLDIVLMERWSNAAEIGVYTIALGVAQLTWVLPQSISTGLFSHSASATDEQAFSYKVARLFRVTVLFALLTVAGLALAGPFVIPLLYGADFERSVGPLQVLLPGVFCFLALKVLHVDLAGRGRPSVHLWVTVPALVINVALNSWLIPRYGAWGAAVTSSVAQGFAGVGFTLLYSRVTHLPLRQLWHFQRTDFDFVRRLIPWSGRRQATAATR